VIESLDNKCFQSVPVGEKGSKTVYLLLQPGGTTHWVPIETTQREGEDIGEQLRTFESLYKNNVRITGTALIFQGILGTRSRCVSEE